MEIKTAITAKMNPDAINPSVKVIRFVAARATDVSNPVGSAMATTTVATIRMKSTAV